MQKDAAPVASVLNNFIACNEDSHCRARVSPTACACLGRLPPKLGMLVGTSVRPNLMATPFWPAAGAGAALDFEVLVAPGRGASAFSSRESEVLPLAGNVARSELVAALLEGGGAC